MPGTLFIVATPIGNLGDITHRAVEILKSADIVACEDTRRTENLLRYLGFAKTTLRYDEHTHERSSRKIIDLLQAGKNVALVTDAGTPAISDPGTRLVKEAASAGVVITPIPGASSVIAAASASGLTPDGFVFLGFLPPRKGRARRLLREAFGLGKTVVVFESPYRVAETLRQIAEIDPDVEVVVGRELTKLHEEFIRGSVSEVREKIAAREQKGEFVLVIGPSKAACASNNEND